MASFVTRAKTHMSKYRRCKLKVFEDGISLTKKKPYPHILPQELSNLNLIETYRTEMLSFIDESGIKLHRDFHHLTSSQCACLNLFWPILNCAGPTLAVKSLGAGRDEVLRWEFEKVINRKEGTNFDLYLELKSGSRSFIEFKYTENSFGSTPKNPGRLQKLRDIYAPALRGTLAPEYLSETKFFKNYQMFRNLTYLDKERGDHLIFVLPKGKERTARRANIVLDSAIHDSILRSMIKIRYLDEVISVALKCLSEENQRLRRHLLLYQEKYLAF